jgi:hypothetical protein
MPSLDALAAGGGEAAAIENGQGHRVRSPSRASAGVPSLFRGGARRAHSRFRHRRRRHLPALHPPPGPVASPPPSPGQPPSAARPQTLNSWPRLSGQRASAPVWPPPASLRRRNDPRAPRGAGGALLLGGLAGAGAAAEAWALRPAAQRFRCAVAIRRRAAGRAMRLGASSIANVTVLSKTGAPVMSTRTPPRKGSAGIRTSNGGARRWPAASTTASTRFRRAAAPRGASRGQWRDGRSGE